MRLPNAGSMSTPARILLDALLAVAGFLASIAASAAWNPALPLRRHPWLSS
jgi:hypothetical protein